MLSKAFNRHKVEEHFIGLIFALALVFAAAHVALHDLDVRGGGLYGNDECQVCRLNHVPVTSSVPASLFHPLRLLAQLFPLEVAEYHGSNLFHTLWTRAPPLF